MTRAPAAWEPGAGAGGHPPAGAWGSAPKPGAGQQKNAAWRAFERPPCGVCVRFSRPWRLQRPLFCAAAQAPGRCPGPRQGRDAPPLHPALCAPMRRLRALLAPLALAAPAFFALRRRLRGAAPGPGRGGTPRPCTPALCAPMRRLRALLAPLALAAPAFLSPRRRPRGAAPAPGRGGTPRPCTPALCAPMRRLRALLAPLALAAPAFFLRCGAGPGALPPGPGAVSLHSPMRPA